MIAKNTIARIIAAKCAPLAVAARLAVVAIAVFALTGMPQAEPASKAPSANAIKMAREIIDLKGSTTLVAPLVVGVIERVKFMHLQTNPSLRKDLDEVAVVLRKQFAPRTEELLGEVAKYYASSFTEPELKEILTFYRTPTGKKVITLEPDLFGNALQALKNWQEDFGEEVMSHFRTEMKKRGKTF